MSNSPSTKESVPSQQQQQQQQQQHHGTTEVLENFVAGFSSGVTGTVIGYPLDLLKTRMQVASKDYKPGTSPTMWRMSVSILKNEGIRGLFKGLMAPLVSISFLSSTTFGSYTWLRRKVGAQKGWDVRNAVAAGVTAPVMSWVTTMEGVVRTQMQMDNVGKKQYHGSWHCLTTISKVHGVHTLFTGLAVTTLRDAAYLCAYFYVYEGLKATLTGNGFQNNYFTVRPELAVPLAGGTAGAMAWLCSFPVDCVRAGVQGQNLEINANTNPHRKKGRQVFQELMASRGIRALYRGVAPTIMRAFIVSSSRFSAYEVTIWALRRNREYEY
ncbi:Congested-like trachea protein [Seminavis robusta]|uniref:Congested-like trachea protein n=1 Tax=Seminavis robusta TaxID=568900 RepID=A0A9N8HH04_9STRA|nr:Congested-like trachea protein [Seminavis robusta]|eukprot:Sro537_g162250.1 Congested-like trachea protein (326) ;mRNA; f:2253-3505